MRKALIISIVMVLLISALSVGFSITPTVKAAPPCVGTPGSPVPGDLSSAVSVNANLDWSDCTNASSYQIYFDTNTSPSTLVGNTSVSNLALPTLNCGTTYYWQVIAVNQSCNTSDTSPVWSFITEITDIDAPASPSPANLSPSVPLDTDLNWADCTGATYYEVYFGNNSSSLPLVYTTNDSICPNANLSVLSTSTTYYWKIVARNECNFINGSIWNFNTTCAAPGEPLTPYPASLSTNIPTSVTLNWSACTDTNLYYLYFGTSSTPAINTSTGSNSFAVSGLNPSTKYYWKVIANGSCGNTSSAIWNFTTNCSTAPSKPLTPHPSNRSTNAPVTVLLNWAASTNVSSYDLYLSTSATPAYCASTTSNSYQTSALRYNTKYYWKVVARNACGSNNSSIWYFTTGCDITVNRPLTPYPGNGSTGVPVVLTLGWSNVANASAYNVYFGTSETPDYTDSTNTSSYTLPQLNYSTRYYWQVQAINASCGYNYSDIWTFTTTCANASGKPLTPTPGNGSVNYSTNVLLDWSDCVNTSSYEVFFSNSSTPTHYVNTTTSSYQLPQLSFNTKYYWRVVSKNACGNNSSDIWNFTTGCPIPSKPQLSSPTNSSTNSSTSVLLDWANCSDATLYDVYFGNSSTPAYYANTTTSSYQLPALNYSTKYYWKVVSRNACGNNSSDTWEFNIGTAPTPTLAPTPTPTPMPTISFDIGGTHASLNTSSTGVVQQVVNITSANATIKIHISAGTIALNDEGEPLDELNMSSTAAYPAASGDRTVIAAFDFDPDGATFNPGIEITLTYDPDTIPAGVNESSLIIAFYNESSEGWEYITGVVNTVANTITFTVNHFTTFAIQTPPVPHAGGGLAAWVIIVIVFFNAIVLGVIAGLYLKHRRIYGSLYYEDEGYVDDQHDKYSEDRGDEEDFKF
jgi:hypothetical protein